MKIFGSRLLAGLAATAVCAACGLAATPGSSRAGGAAGTQSPTPAGPESIAGKLLFTDGAHPAGRPGASATLALYPESASVDGKVLLPSPGPPLGTTTTDAEGRFEFHGLASGRYFLSLYALGAGLPGRWITVGPGTSPVEVTFVVCGDCPILSG